MSPLYSCSLEIQSTEHYFRRCHDYFNFRTALMNKLNSINTKLESLESDELARSILYGDKNLIMTPVQGY